MKKHPWSCMTAALAHALNIQEEELFEWVGHDGGEIVRPVYTDVRMYRGFHPQELIDAIMRNSPISPIYIEYCPTMVTSIELDRPAFVFDDPDVRFTRYLDNTCGAVFGRFKWALWNHALANICGELRDLDKEPYAEVNYSDFQPYGYLMLT